MEANRFAEAKLRKISKLPGQSGQRKDAEGFADGFGGKFFAS